MYKILIITALFLSGCSHFRVTAAMCQKLESEPGATVPQECRAYSEKEADKAFNKVTDKKRVLDSDIEFHKEK
jgi:flagellar basal body-associated protein FliL